MRILRALAACLFSLLVAASHSRGEQQTPTYCRSDSRSSERWLPAIRTSIGRRFRPASSSASFSTGEEWGSQPSCSRTTAGLS